MSANTTYYAKVPKITYEWIQVSALVADDVREQYPDAIEVLHWSQYEEEVDQLKKSVALKGVPKSIESNKKRSESHKGKKHEYALGDKNVMRRPEVAAKLKVPKPKYTCKFCGRIVGNISNIRKHENACSANHTSSKYALSNDDAVYRDDRTRTS